MHVELKHTLTVNRNAWFIRFYLWLWEGDLEKISFCKLFWAYVFALPAMILRFGIAEPIAWMRRHAPRPKRKPKPKPHPRSLRMQRALDRIEVAGTRSVWAFGRAWRIISLGGRLQLWGGRVLIAVGALVGAGLLALAVYLGAKYVTATIIVTASIIGIVAGTGLVILLKALGVLDAAVTLVFGASYRLKRGTLGFLNVMRLGYVAVKSNTCPRVDLQ